MKYIASTLALSIALAALSNPSPALAASGGRISSGSFRSAPSRSYSPSRGGSSYSYRPAAPSRSYSRGLGSPSSSYRSVTSRPSASRYDHEEEYTPYRSYPDRYHAPAVIVAPPIITPPVVVPSVSPPIAAPVQSTVPTAPSTTNSSPINFWLNFLILVPFAVVALGLLGFFKPLLPKKSSPSGKGRATVSKIQVALLASAKDLRETLIRLANNSDTGTEEGLSEVLKESCLAILRNPDLVVYANSETHVGYLPAVEELFNRKVVEERSKLDDEVVTNIAGKHLTSYKVDSEDKANEYIAVTLLAATSSSLNLPGTGDMSDLKQSLINLGSVEPEDILALEVLWQPEGKGETLSRDELLTLYPELQNV